MKKTKILPLTYYEIFGLGRGCSILDINNQYERLKKVYVIENPMLRDIFDDESLFVYNAFLDSVYRELTNHELRKEYDMEMEEHLNSLEESFPDTFFLSEVVKRYNRNKKGGKKLIKKDVFGREADKKNFTVEDLDLIESNEAFAAQACAVGKELNFDPEKVNVNGGSIAMGHPLGATGAMILGTLLDELERQGKKRGLATLCVGGGMGIATIIEVV